MLTIQCGIVLFVYGYPTFQIDVHYYVCPKGCVVVLRVTKLCGGLGTINRLGSFGMQLYYLSATTHATSLFLGMMSEM